jgi:hypothetical protein
MRPYLYKGIPYRLLRRNSALIPFHFATNLLDLISITNIGDAILASPKCIDFPNLAHQPKPYFQYLS